MKQVLEFLGFIALAQGVGGLVHVFTDRFPWGFVQRWAVLDGYEILAGIVLIVLAGAMFALAERLDRAEPPR